MEIIQFALLLPQLITLSACVFYMMKKNTVEGTLLLIGSTGGFLLSIFHQYILPQMPKEEVMDIVYTTAPAGFISSLCFGVGLFMLVYKHTMKTKTLDSDHQA